MGRNRELSYEVMSAHGIGIGGAVTSARFVCYRCRRESQLNLGNGSGGHNPDQVIKRLHRTGWQGDKNRRASIICQVCVKARDARYEQHSQKAKMAKEEPSNVINIKPVPQSTPAATATLTTIQRNACRDRLDQHFDVESGCYSADWSDQRIAKEIGCGFALVAQMRDVAYGPLRGDPEVNAVRAELAQCKKDSAAILDLVAKQDSMIAALEKRIAKTAERFAP